MFGNKIIQTCLLTILVLTGSMKIARGQNEIPDTKLRPLTDAQIEQMLEEVSNWGRWGKDDELGTLNLITPAKRKEAARLVEDGVVVSLAHDLIKEMVWEKLRDDF